MWLLKQHCAICHATSWCDCRMDGWAQAFRSMSIIVPQRVHTKIHHSGATFHLWNKQDTVGRDYTIWEDYAVMVWVPRFLWTSIAAQLNLSWPAVSPPGMATALPKTGADCRGLWNLLNGSSKSSYHPSRVCTTSAARGRPRGSCRTHIIPVIDFSVSSHLEGDTRVCGLAPAD